MTRQINLTEEDTKLLEGTIRAIRLDMEWGEVATYFDSDNPDYDNNDEDWKCAEMEKRNGTKICALIRKILAE